MIPRPIRLFLFVAGCLTILYLSLAPTTAIPSVTLWDKVEHATAYFGLSLLGIWAFPERARPVVVGLILGGIGVEIAQATMGWGRDGDPLDAVANTIGVAVGTVLALGVGWAFARLRRD